MDMNLDRLMQNISEEYTFLQEQTKDIDLDSVAMVYQNRPVTAADRPPLQRTASQILSLSRQCGILVEDKIRSRVPLLGGVVVFIKRLLRKLMRCYIVPIGEAQTHFNQETVNILTGLQQATQYQNVLEDRIDEIEYLRLLEEKQMHQDFEKRLLQLERENAALCAEVAQLMKFSGREESMSGGKEGRV